MGCFSFLCKESGKAALSTSFDGSPCRLFLLKKGKVIEEMHGNYDSYGRVFNGKGDSFKWNLPWGDVCDLMFSSNSSNGVAVVLDKYWTGTVPTTRSEDDPNQGWGGEDDEECLFASVEDDRFEKVENPYHKIYEVEDEPEKPMTAEEFLSQNFSSTRVNEELQRLRKDYLRDLGRYLSYEESHRLFKLKESLAEIPAMMIKVIDFYLENN